MESLIWIPTVSTKGMIRKNAGLSEKIAKKEYNGIHFRLEADMIIFKHDINSYWHWLRLVRNNETIEAIEKLKGIVFREQFYKYLHHIIHDYESLVLKYFHPQYPIILATDLGKGNPLNAPLEWVLNLFMSKLQLHGYESIIGNGNSSFREINSASEMKLMLNCESFIGTNTSTFSTAIMKIRAFNNASQYSVSEHRFN